MEDRGALEQYLKQCYKKYHIVLGAHQGGLVPILRNHICDYAMCASYHRAHK